MKVHDKNFSCKATVYDDSHNNVSEAIGAASSHKILNCALCNATFKTARGRDDHLVKQHPNSIASVDRTIHECTKCAYRTILKHDFDKHNVLIHPEILSPFKLRECIHCNATFKSRASLDDHTLRKHPDFIATITRKIHECTKCSYKTIFRYDLDRHDASSHPEAVSCIHCNSYTAKSYSESCVHCNAKYQQRISLDDHIIKKHPEFITSVTRKVYECTICPYKTILKFKFDRHMLEHPETASSYKFSSCHHCGAKFKIKADLDEHLVENHPNFIVSLSRKVYECTYCVYKTTVKKSLDKHMSSHPEADPSETFTCIHCDAIVKSRNALTDHVVRKHPNFITSVTNKIYECTQCVYKTVKKYDLDKHLSTHSKTASRSNFSTCIHCNATFNTDKWLDAHIVKTHPGFAGSLTRKIYECTLCPYKTVFKYKLDRHMLKHAETDKINACIHCNATFKNKADLDEHVVRRHPNFTSSLSRKIYECTQCVYKSLRKKSFVKHMSRHPEAVPGDSLNRCVHCNATLRSKRALDDHVVRKHPDSAAPVGRKILECTECRFKTVLKGSLAQHMLTHFKAYNL
nr:unnamed protein product [Callosobruchus chinensis]